MATVVLAPLLPTLYSILQNPGKTMVLPFLPFVAALISVLLKLKWIQERKAAKKYLNWIDLEMTMHIFMLKTALMDWLILVMSGSIMTKVEGKYIPYFLIQLPRKLFFFEFIKAWQFHIFSSLSFPLCNENLNSFLTRWGNYSRRGNYSREETI